MNAFEKIINQSVPATLFHYTNSAGMMGIVSTSSIWCTHTQYLNDIREFCHAIDLFRDEISFRIKNNKDEDNFLRQFLEWVLIDAEAVNVCVASFSTEPDSLSQWRAYAAAPGGFAIGFNGTELKRAVEKNNAQLLPCIYDEQTQVDIVRVLVDFMAEKKDFIMAGSVLYGSAPILKHHAFSAEQEWRILTRPMSVVADNFNFRAGPSMLIPFIKMKISEKPADLKLNRIIVGPTPSPTPSIRSATSFLLKYDLKTELQASSAPFRSW